MTVAERIDKILQEKKMSRRKLAQLADIPPSTLQSAMERGGDNFSYYMIAAIAKALNVSPTSLLFDPYLEKRDLEFIKKNIHRSMLLEKYINVAGYRLVGDWFEDSKDILLLDDKEKLAYRIKAEYESEFEHSIHDFIEFKINKLLKLGRLEPPETYFPPTPDKEQQEKEE